MQWSWGEWSGIWVFLAKTPLPLVLRKARSQVANGGGGAVLAAGIPRGNLTQEEDRDQTGHDLKELDD